MLSERAEDMFLEEEKQENRSGTAPREIERGLELSEEWKRKEQTHPRSSWREEGGPKSVN